MHKGNNTEVHSVHDRSEWADLALKIGQTMARGHLDALHQPRSDKSQNSSAQWGFSITCRYLIISRRALPGV